MSHRRRWRKGVGHSRGGAKMPRSGRRRHRELQRVAWGRRSWVAPMVVPAGAKPAYNKKK